MKRINQLAMLALSLLLAGGALSDTEAQRKGRQSIRAAQMALRSIEAERRVEADAFPGEGQC